jgi:hypothetical protein
MIRVMWRVGIGATMSPASSRTAVGTPQLAGASPQKTRHHKEGKDA